MIIVKLFFFSRNKDKYMSTSGGAFWDKQSGVILDALFATVWRGKPLGAKCQGRLESILW